MIELFEMTGLRQEVVDIAKRGEILDGESDAVEERDLVLRRAARRRAGVDLPKLGDRVIPVELLEFALDMGLIRKLYEDVGPEQDVPVQLGLAGAVAANRVDMHARTDHVVGQDRRRVSCPR